MQLSIAILAGGNGKRLWPISTIARPKQFIKLPFLKKSTFQLALLRALSLTSKDNIFIIASQDSKDILFDQLKELEIDSNHIKIILEEVGDNTGMALYNCSRLLLDLKKDNATILFPSDQLLKVSTRVLKDLIAKMHLEKINILGQEVLEIDNQFGYIFTESEIHHNYYKVRKFIEKPVYIELGKKAYKNLGIYISKPSLLVEEFEKY